MRTQKIQSTNAPIEGRGTPEDLSQNNKNLNPKILWRLDCEIRPFLLSPIVEEADGSEAKTMAELEDVKNDSIQELHTKRRTPQVLYVFFEFSIYLVV